MARTHTESPLLQVRGLTSRISGQRRVELCFELQRGAVLQLAGPSGCGKTTALRLLARLTRADRGELLLHGKPAAEIAAPAWRRQLTYLAQQPVMFEGSVLDNLLAGYATSSATSRPDDLRPQAQQLMARLGLEQEVLDQDARLLSGGEAARVALGRALLLEPAVLLADEPTAALDPDNAAALVRVVRAWTGDGGAMILVAHDAAPWEGLPRQLLDLATGQILFSQPEPEAGP